MAWSTLLQADLLSAGVMHKALVSDRLQVGRNADVILGSVSSFAFPSCQWNWLLRHLSNYCGDKQQIPNRKVKEWLLHPMSCQLSPEDAHEAQQRSQNYRLNGMLLAIGISCRSKEVNPPWLRLWAQDDQQVAGKVMAKHTLYILMS